jgi:hypothetical protein
MHCAPKTVVLNVENCSLVVNLKVHLYSSFLKSKQYFNMRHYNLHFLQAIFGCCRMGGVCRHGRLYGYRITECGLRMRIADADYGLRITDYGLRITDYGLRITDYGLRIADCGLRITDYGLRITDYGLRITDYGLRIADCGLRIADCEPM